MDYFSALERDDASLILNAIISGVQLATIADSDKILHDEKVSRADQKTNFT